VEPLKGFHSNGRLLAFPENIRLGQKSVTLSNTIIYGCKSFIVLVQGFVTLVKLFTGLAPVSV
jgi:hypothetical protein